MLHISKMIKMICKNSPASSIWRNKTVSKFFLELRTWFRDPISTQFQAEQVKMQHFLVGDLSANGFIRTLMSLYRHSTPSKFHLFRIKISRRPFNLCQVTVSRRYNCYKVTLDMIIIVTFPRNGHVVLRWLISYKSWPEEFVQSYCKVITVHY